MDSNRYQSIEATLVGLAKLIKSTCYYPEGHPSLNLAINQALELFEQRLTVHNEPLILTISRQGFQCDQRSLSITNPLAKNLAKQFFAHKIKALTILPELLDRHLFTFAQLIGEEPTAITAMGGLQHLLDQRHVGTIAVNELNLASVLMRQQTIEREMLAGSNNDSDSGVTNKNKAQQLIDNFEAQQKSTIEIINKIETLLNQAPPNHDSTLQELLTQLMQLLQQIVAGSDRDEAIPAIQSVGIWLSNTALNQQHHATIRESLQILCDRPLIDLLIDNATTLSGQELTKRIVVQLNDEVGTILIARLGKEIDTKLRKFINHLLMTMGDKVFPPLIDNLQDERWFVVRNAVAILAESRSEQLIPEFVRLLRHNDSRVVNEAIKALSRIKSSKSCWALIDQLKSGSGDVPHQVILTLGALADPVAVPALVETAKKFDPMLSNKALTKSAIHALGDIGTPDCVEPLIQIMQRPKLISRQEYNEIRCIAATALGKFKDPQSFTALEKAAKSTKRQLATAARQALRQRGAKHHES